MRLSRWRPRNDFNELRTFIGPASIPAQTHRPTAIFGADHRDALRRRQWATEGGRGEFALASASWINPPVETYPTAASVAWTTNPLSFGTARRASATYCASFS